MTKQIKNLPWNSEQFSFALKYRSDQDEQVNMELSCVCFNRQGQVTDAVYPGKNAMLKNSIVNNQDSSLYPPNIESAEGDSIIYAFPKHICPPYEVFCFVASAPLLPERANDLNSSSELSFTVSYLGTSSEPAGQEIFNLKPYVTEPHPSGSLGLGNGQNSMVICTMFQDGKHPGWTLHFNFSTFNFDMFGAIVPELKGIILDIYNTQQIDLDAAKNMEIKPEDRMVVSRQFQDGVISDLSKLVRPDSATSSITRLRFDLSWAAYTEPGQPEDEVEDWSPEFTLTFYNYEGEEVVSAGSGNAEAEGLKVGLPEPEEPEEKEEDEEKEEEKEEEEEEGEGEEGEAAEAPPKEEKPDDPMAFPLKDRIELTLAELPPECRAGILVFANYTDIGFVPLKFIKVRVYDISGGDDAPVLISAYSVLSKRNGDKGMSQVVLYKLYKEFMNSAFALWASSTVNNIEQFIHGDVDVVEAIQAHLDSHKALKSREEAAIKAAEDEGEEFTGDLREFVWRLSIPSLMLGGSSLEDAEHDIKNVLNYDGALAGGTSRSSKCARVTYPNKDSYVGGYLDDLKHGLGIYTFANGAVYVGEYAGGKRHGHGKMILPDGGLYEGEFANDKFDGLGRYKYPDGSVYTGHWKDGRKHGDGVYWDASGGCLHGVWDKGVLKGQAAYEQPAYHFEGMFVRGIPAGPATFTLCPHRTLDMPKFAAAHIIAPNGPSLSQTVEYVIPPGSGDEPKEEGAEDEPVGGDEDKPPLPEFPKYEGLSMVIETAAMVGEDLMFPPEAGLPVPIPNVPSFTVEAGLVPPTAS